MISEFASSYVLCPSNSLCSSLSGLCSSQLLACAFDTQRHAPQPFEGSVLQLDLSQETLLWGSSNTAASAMQTLVTLPVSHSYVNSNVS